MAKSSQNARVLEQGVDPSAVDPNAAASGENQSSETPAVTETATAANANKRQPKASVTYAMADGTEKNFPNKDAVSVVIETTGGTKRVYELSKLGENVKLCAIQQGLVTRFQRGYQALKLEDEVIASIDGTIEDLDADIWIEVGSGEPRVTNLIQAIVMALEAEGQTVDAARRAAISDKLASDENLRKETRERPAIAANLAQLASEAAAKRAAEKRVKASENTESATVGF